MAHPYIDPKRKRPSTEGQRRARARHFAAQAAHEARGNKLRLLVHGVIICLGIWAFRHTDIHSDDPFESATLVLLDMLFCIYLLLMLFIESWRAGQR